MALPCPNLKVQTAYLDILKVMNEGNNLSKETIKLERILGYSAYLLYVLTIEAQAVHSSFVDKLSG